MTIMTNKRKPRILLYDIENTHNIVATFGLFKAFIQHENILQHWFMLCFAAQWYGESKIHSVSLLDDPVRFSEDHTDDYYVVARLHELLSEADAVVAHNGDRFDMKKFNARAILHGLPPIHNVVQIDTLKIAKAKFAFNYNRLDYLGEYLGVGRKIKTDNALWLACLKGNKKAIKEMVVYNIQDIDLLGKVYEKLRPYVPAKINYNLFTDNVVCTHCGSSDVVEGRTRYTLTRAYKSFQCNDCGGYSQYTLSDRLKKAGVK